MLVTRTTDATNCWLPVCLYLTLLMTCIETPRLAWWHLAGVGSLYTGAASWRMLFLLLLPHSAVLSQTPVYTARPHMVHPAWCIHGSYGQGKSKYHGAKVNKNAEKNLNCCTQTAYSGSTFVWSFGFYVHFWICFSSLVSSVIASDWKPTLIFHANGLVRENNSFCPGKSGKVRENEFCKVVWGTKCIA